eukprot:8214179-Alexandrium_andersonii.AAC.3
MPEADDHAALDHGSRQVHGELFASKSAHLPPARPFSLLALLGDAAILPTETLAASTICSLPDRWGRVQDLQLLRDVSAHCLPQVLPARTTLEQATRAEDRAEDGKVLGARRAEHGARDC